VSATLLAPAGTATDEREPMAHMPSVVEGRGLCGALMRADASLAPDDTPRCADCERLFYGPA
jgi:hypothetical protein